MGEILSVPAPNARLIVTVCPTSPKLVKKLWRSQLLWESTVAWRFWPKPFWKNQKLPTSHKSDTLAFERLGHLGALFGNDLASEARRRVFDELLLYDFRFGPVGSSAQRWPYFFLSGFPLRFFFVTSTGRVDLCTMMRMVQKLWSNVRRPFVISAGIK